MTTPKIIKHPPFSYFTQHYLSGTDNVNHLRQQPSQHLYLSSPECHSISLFILFLQQQQHSLTRRSKLIQKKSASLQLS